MFQVEDRHALIVSEPDEQSCAPQGTNKVERSWGRDRHRHRIHHSRMHGIGNVEHQRKNCAFGRKTPQVSKTASSQKKLV